MNPKVTKRGLLFWKKTVVEHSGGTSEFSGNAEVIESNGSVCVKEAGLISSETSCFLKQDRASSGLPDGTLVGRSKSIDVQQADGTSRTYQSGPLSLHSMEKHGEEIVVKKSGLFGDKVVDRVRASSVSNIVSEDCNVCKSLNPLYR